MRDTKSAKNRKKTNKSIQQIRYYSHKSENALNQKNRVKGKYVVARVNHTITTAFKVILRQLMNPEWSEKKQREEHCEDPLEKKIDSEELKELIKKAVELHNDKINKKGISPNLVENALVQHRTNGGEHPERVTARNGTPEAKIIEIFKQDSTNAYLQSALKWFTEFREENKQAHEKTIREIRMQAEKSNIDAEERHLNQIEELRLMKEDAEQKYQSVVTQNLELIKRMKNAEQDAKLVADALRKKQEAKEKRQRAEKKPLRDIISSDQFEALIKSLRCTGSPEDIQRARRIVAYFLLRLTGLRVSNLLLINVRQIKEMFEKGTTKLELIKGGHKKFNLLIPQSQMEWFKGCSFEVDALCRGKSEGDPLFHGNNIKNPMNRSNFDTDLNAPLKPLSETAGANFKTHSFRATVITELLGGGVNINEVADYMGHASTASTARYDKNPESLPRLLEISKIINRKRSRAPKKVESLVSKMNKRKKHPNNTFIKNITIPAEKPASIRSGHQILSNEEFNILISQVYRLNCSPLLQARIFVAYQLLRICTIRASDLPSLTVGQMKNFQKTSILEIVNTRHSHGLRLHLTEEVRDCFFHICEPFLDVLYDGKVLNDPLLTGKNSLSKAISCTKFSSQLNKLLRSRYEAISDFPIITSSLHVGNGSLQGWIKASRFTCERETGRLFIKTPELSVLNRNTPATLKKTAVLSARHFDLLIGRIYSRSVSSKRNLSQIRTGVAFHLLRICKLKISELSQITVGPIKEFLRTSILEFRGGSYSSKEACVFLNLCLPSLDVLFLGKDLNDPLFHGKSKKKKINTKVFCTELNAPLKNKDILCLGFPVKLSSLHDRDSFPWEEK